MIETLSKLVRGENLTEHEAAFAFEKIMRGDATPVQIAGFMVALRMKGETVEELTGFARTARAMATPIDVEGDLLDTCGTGGDGMATFNISTLSAIIAAACGVKVAKHGNRAASSLCGSADVLEQLGVKIDLAPEGVARTIRDAGIGFLFAPLFHPSFRYAGVPRREEGELVRGIQEDRREAQRVDVPVDGRLPLGDPDHRHEQLEARRLGRRGKVGFGDVGHGIA